MGRLNHDLKSVDQAIDLILHSLHILFLVSALFTIENRDYNWWALYKHAVTLMHIRT